MYRLLARFRNDAGGAVMLEFALSLPVLIVLIFGTIDIGRLALAHLKMYNAASSLADLASRDETLSTDTVNDLFSAIEHIVRPYTMGPQGRVILTGVSADAPDDPRVFWQVSGAGTLGEASRIGSAGGEADLPGTMSIDDQETIIAAEVFYLFQPIFAMPLADTLIHQTAFFRPRLGSLRSLE